MFQFFRSLFGTDFMPHLYCLRGDPGVLWLQVIADALIALAYYAIPLVLFEVVRRRKEAMFRKIAFLFVLFIAACGTTHVLDIWTIWSPMYRLEATGKALTAVLSVATAIVLLRLRTTILSLPSIAELTAEIAERRRIEEANQEKEERFRNFVESVQDYALCMLDMDGRVASWNSGAERIKGYKAEEIVGKHFSCFYSTEEVAAGVPEETLRMAVEMGCSEHEGWRMRKDGTRFWANAVVRPIRNTAGELTGFAKVTRDLSAARAMEVRYQTLLDATPDAILMVGQEGRIVFANARSQKLFGYSKAELLGRSVDALVPERYRVAHREHRLGYFNAPRNREMGSGQELWGLRKDGSEFAVEVSLNPLETRDGPVALAAIRDVTERKRAERRFRALIDAAPDAMVIVNSDGLIEISNRQVERLFGYAQTELVGEPVTLLIPEELREGHTEQLAHYFSVPRLREMGAGLNLSARRKDGSLFPVEISLSPLESEEGTVVTATIRDVTERRQAAAKLAQKMEELRHSNEELEQFAHVASHDLQEPLRMVASYTQLLAKRYKGKLGTDADEFIHFAVDGTQRMKRLIEDLLMYSRVGKGAPPMRHFNSGEALREALNNLHSAIQESQAVVTYDPMPEVMAVEPQLAQVFQNLVANAIKYRGERVPEVKLSATAKEDEWQFSVRDNGIGIPPEYFERVFVIFQRLHGREEYEGTGLGLAICRRIVQQHGGRIWVESEKGHGATFHFTLPKR